MNTHSDDSRLYIGIDLGTSGCRAIAIDNNDAIVSETATVITPAEIINHSVEQSPSIWWDATKTTLNKLFEKIPKQQVHSIAVDGTSGSLLLADKAGHHISPALMYNDARAVQQAQQIAEVAPRDCAAHGVSSGLAKCLWLQEQDYATDAQYLLSQSDWINGQLSGVYGISDKNNCMKLGFDAVNNNWPQWLDQLNINRNWLPQVVSPGEVIATIRKEMADYFGLHSDVSLIAGTTDSTAAFLATGASQPGDAVTSLGSTLVLKVISTTPVFAPEYGIYSQPLNENWLVGGASNSGGAVLLNFFSQTQLDEMTPMLDPANQTGLDYYPLTATGERFPVNNPQLKPTLSPRPESDIRFFQAILEGIARIEHSGYQKLSECGVPYPGSIRTVGGGAKNNAWQTIRQQMLKTDMVQAKQVQAAYGTALLAAKPFRGDA